MKRLILLPSIMIITFFCSCFEGYTICSTITAITAITAFIP